MKKLLLFTSLISVSLSHAGDHGPVAGSLNGRQNIQAVIDGLKKQELTLSKTADAILEEVDSIKNKRERLEITLKAPKSFIYKEKWFSHNYYGDGSKKGTDPVTDEDILKRNKAIEECNSQTGEHFKAAYDYAYELAQKSCQKNYTKCDELLEMRGVFFDNKAGSFYMGACNVSVQVKGTNLRIDE